MIRSVMTGAGCPCALLTAIALAAASLLAGCGGDGAPVDTCTARCVVEAAVQYQDTAEPVSDATVTFCATMVNADGRERAPMQSMASLTDDRGIAVGSATYEVPPDCTVAMSASLDGSEQVEVFTWTFDDIRGAVPTASEQATVSGSCAFFVPRE